MSPDDRRRTPQTADASHPCWRVTLAAAAAAAAARDNDQDETLSEDVFSSSSSAFCSVWMISVHHSGQSQVIINI